MNVFTGEAGGCVSTSVGGNLFVEELIVLVRLVLMNTDLLPSWKPSPQCEECVYLRKLM